jgi:hypothetical protein
MSLAIAENEQLGDHYRIWLVWVLGSEIDSSKEKMHRIFSIVPTSEQQAA